MDGQGQRERKIEFKKRHDIVLKKYSPKEKNKICKIKIAKYVSAYEFNNDSPGNSELLI